MEKYIKFTCKGACPTTILVFWLFLFMLRRWDVRVYDVGFLMAALDYVLDFMDLDSRISGRFWRSPRLYVKAWF